MNMIVNRSAPSATIVPILVYDDVETALDFLVRAFGFAERLRAQGADGRVTHAQLTFAEGSIIIGRQGGPFRAPQGAGVSQYVVVHVKNVDDHFQVATSFGARTLDKPHDMPFGERQYTVEDPGGHWWTFSQHIADVQPSAWGALEAMPGAPSA
jgi:uncharacterized glyoxalase superfamily protein PhnB